MGLVYKGYDPALNRYVAIKLLPKSLETDPTLTQRFQREAKAAAGLDHPNIVGVYYFGHQHDVHYLVMKYVEGIDLRAEIDRRRRASNPFTSEEILHILGQVAAGLDYAHQRGVIHRDVKPGNILLASDGQAVLSDFGLAMLRDRASQITLGHSFGTPEYIAPEQAIDSRGAVPQSDIYSLGGILYEMVTFRLPFEAESSISLALKHISEEPTPPRHYVPDLPPAVEAVILRALAKEAADRFATARAMIEALRRAWREASAVGVPAAGEPAVSERAVPPAPIAAPPPPPPLPQATRPTALHKPTMVSQTPPPPSRTVVAETTTATANTEAYPSPQAHSNRPLVRGVLAILIVGLIAGLAITRGGPFAAAFITPSVTGMLATNTVRATNTVGVEPSATVTIPATPSPTLKVTRAAPTGTPQSPANASPVPTGALVPGKTALPTASPTASLTPTPTPSDTPTPTATPTATPTSTTEPSSTPSPTASPTASPTPTLIAGQALERAADGMVMRFVPGGSFLMGSSDPNATEREKPQIEVDLGPFWIDQTEVTNAQYRLCVEAGKCSAPVVSTAFDNPTKANHPVAYVNWQEATVYCAWLADESGWDVHLPTEAQWEKAAAWDPVTQNKRPYPWGDTPPDRTLLNFNSTGLNRTTVVGSYPAGVSPYGTQDCAGNVWEWVADWYDKDYYQKASPPVLDPTGPDKGKERVTRGGSFGYGAAECRATFRNFANPDKARGSDLGFRCATSGERLPKEL